MLRLFKVNEEDIIPTEKITPEDIVLVSNESTKNLYLYRGKYCPNLDQFQSSVLYERIVNRFLNPNIFTIKSLVNFEEDSGELKEIKQTIIDHYPDLKKYQFKRSIQELFLLKSFRNTLINFRNYQNSRVWRSKLSNLTNIWNLSLFNILAIISVVVILSLKTIFGLNTTNFIFITQNNTIDISLWQLWLHEFSFTLGLCLIILIFTFLVNIMFILFPLKFPINPHALSSLASATKTSIESTKSAGIKENIISPEIKVPNLPPTVPASKMSKMPKPQIKINLSKSFIDNKSENLLEIGQTDEDLNIPPLPKKKIITPKSGELNFDVPNLEEIVKKDTDLIKNILVEDTIDNKNIIVPVPRELVVNSKDPVVEITFITGEPQHAVVIQVDHDFQVRR